MIRSSKRVRNKQEQQEQEQQKRHEDMIVFIKQVNRLSTLIGWPLPSCNISVDKETTAEVTDGKPSTLNNDHELGRHLTLYSSANNNTDTLNFR
jgi:hypothetical protein